MISVGFYDIFPFLLLIFYIILYLLVVFGTGLVLFFSGLWDRFGYFLETLVWLLLLTIFECLALCYTHVALHFWGGMG